MASDFYINLEGIAGESQDSAHNAWIEVTNYSLGALQNVISGRGTDVTGRGQFKNFVFTHLVDKASPKILHYCMSGQKIPKVVFHVCRAVGGAQTVVFEVTMELVKIVDVDISSERQNLNSDGIYDASISMERVSMVCNKTTWKFTTIKEDNSIEGSIEAAFDQVINK